MTSSINTNNIDTAYPVAGQDNDSQGFRDNFTAINTNFAAAKSEIEDLQGKVLLKSPLLGTILDNDLSGATLTGAALKSTRTPRVALGSVTGAVSIDFRDGHYQTMTTTGSITLTVTNWPAAGQYGKVRLEITVADTDHVVTFPAAVTIGKAAIKGVSNDSVIFDEVGTYVFELGTANFGSSISITDLSRVPAGVAVTDRLATDATTTLSSLGDMGLSFVGAANATYQFEAFIPFQHTVGDGSASQSWAVNWSNGTGSYVVEQQTTSTSAFTVTTEYGADGASSAATNSLNVRYARITGIVNLTAADTVHMRFATTAGTLTVLTGATLKATRIA